jgi:hypothetical protein
MLVVNLFGGPGVGKSTTSSLVFGKLKGHGINAEYVTEYAKDLVWEERFQALAYQPYITAKQIWRQQRLRGKVDVIVTDSPIFLGVIYSGVDDVRAFKPYVLQTFCQFDNLNILLRRNSVTHPWNPKGRVQTEEAAVSLDDRVKYFLDDYTIPYEEIPVQTGELTANHLVQIVLSRLG